MGGGAEVGSDREDDGGWELRKNIGKQGRRERTGTRRGGGSGGE